jgi:hypothetical protein
MLTSLNEVVKTFSSQNYFNQALTTSSTLLGHTQDNIKHINKHLTIMVGLSLNTIRLMLGT